MSSRLISQIFAALALVALGILSGLPFREKAMPEAAVAPPAIKRLGHAAPTSEDRPHTPDQEMVLALTSNDPETLRRAFDRCLTLVVDDANPDVSWLIARRWAEVDPAGMYRHLMATGGPSRKLQGENYESDFAYILFRSWVKSDPDAAIAASLELARHRRYPGRGGLMEVALHLVKEDPERARGLAGEHRIAFVSALNQALQNAPERGKLMSFLAELHPTYDQIQMLGNHLGNWLQDEQAREESWAWLEGQSDEIRSRLLDQLAGWQLNLSPGMLMAMKNHFSTHQDLAAKFAGNFADALVAEDGFEGALAWANESLRGAAQHQALAALLAKAGSAELQQVDTVYDSLRPGSVKDATVSVIVGRMTKEGDPVGALHWINEQALRGQTRARAVEHWGYQWARSDPDGVADYLNETGSTEEGALLLNSVNQRMAFNQEGGPLALGPGVDWVARLRNDAQAAEAASMVFRGYGAQAEIEAARAAAQALTRPAVRAAALAALESINTKP